MKSFSIVALASLLSIAVARDVYFEHADALHVLKKRQSTAGNLATFTGALGGVAVTAITCSGDSTRQFEVNGNTFVNFAAAAQRSCDIQNNACANAANAGGQSFTVPDCNAQQATCNTEQTATTPTCPAGGAAAATTAAAAVTTAATAATTVACAAPPPTPTPSCGSAKFRKI